MCDNNVKKELVSEFYLFLIYIYIYLTAVFVLSIILVTYKHKGIFVCEADGLLIRCLSVLCNNDYP